MLIVNANEGAKCEHKVKNDNWDSDHRR
uniref:Uncharacterized protein n=1 Tax=Tetranychus urticae TaxID=32264 RepID=T1KNF8_TETUR